MAFLKRTALLRGLLLSACLALSPWLAAQDELVDNFSAPPEIQKRLAAAPALR